MEKTNTKKTASSEITKPAKKASVAPAKGHVKIVEQEKAAHAHKEQPKHDVKHEEKTPAKAEAKHETKAAKEVKAVEKKPKKVKQKSRKIIPKKSKEAQMLAASVLSKASHPTFRGRFGKRNIRRKSISKWNVWRQPHGIDVKKMMSDGYFPHIGFSQPKEFRHVHPSGYREFVVRSAKDVEAIPQGHAARIVAGIGSKKKMEIVDKAIAKGVRVLNP